VGDAAYCAEIVPFDPDVGPGYLDYAFNGKTPDNQYRSFLRRDGMILTKYAAAMTECEAANRSLIHLELPSIFFTGLLYLRMRY